MLPLDVERVAEFAREASTQDLLNLVTVYRQGVESEAVLIIEKELRHRGVGSAQILAHDLELRRHVLFDDNGAALSCSFCKQPAVSEGWGWHRLWGVLPLFPRKLRFCPGHLPSAEQHKG
jgi:hypothetical protein